MTDNRLYGADFVRAAACLTVLFHHLAQRMSWRDELGFIEWFRGFAQVGTFGVAGFFVLSGFLLARPFWQALDRGEPMPSLRTYALRRAARILPGFWLALVVTFALSVAVFGSRLDGELLLRLIAGMFLVADWHWVTLFPVDVNGPLWSISFEATAYVLLPLGFLMLFPLRRLIGAGWRGRIAWIGVIGAALVLHWLFLRYYPVDQVGSGWDHGLIGGAKYWMPRFNPFGFFAMFAIGALGGGVQVLLSGRRSLLFDGLAIAGMCLALYALYRQLDAPTPDGWGWLDVPYGFPWFVLCVALILAVTPSSAVIGRLLDNPLSRYIARISFGIYIWHYPVLELVRLYWDPDIDHGRATDPVQFLVTSGVVIAITVVIAHLSFHFVENPAIRWARRRERPNEATATLSPAAG